MIERDGTIYFLYSPESGMSEAKGAGPSAWGAAALMSAIDEGLAGICNEGCGYDELYFCPRFPVTDYTELRYITGYELSAKKVDVRYVLADNGMRYLIKSPATKIRAHILLPAGRSCRQLRVDGKNHRFKTVSVGSSNYVDFELSASGTADIEVLF